MKWLIVILLLVLPVKTLADDYSDDYSDSMFGCRESFKQTHAIKSQSLMEKFYSNASLVQRARSIGIEINNGVMSVPFIRKNFPPDNPYILDRSVDIMIEIHKLGFELSLTYGVYEHFHILVRLAEKGFILPNGIKYPARRQDLADRLRNLGYTLTN